ncbi:hypothetical protein D3C71_1725790 [compost metagenome]
MAQVEAADAGRGHHCQAFGQRHADVGALQRLEQRDLRGVVGAGGIAGRGADALVLFLDQLGIAELLAGRIAPQVGAHALVQAFGKSFGQTVGQ